MTSGEIKLAPCPSCSKQDVSVNAAACPNCGEPITASIRSAMIRGVEEQRERAAQEALEAEERRKKSEELQNREREARLKVAAINQKIDALMEARPKALIKCSVCGGSYTRHSGHEHPVSPEERDRIIEKITTPVCAFPNLNGLATSEAPETEEERKIKEDIYTLIDEKNKLIPVCSWCHERHFSVEKCQLRSGSLSSAAGSYHGMGLSGR
jgi:rubredoxin